VRREELHVDRTPIAGGEPAPPADGRTAGHTAGRELVLLLSEEVPVVTMTTRPVERVHVRIETVTGSQSVTAALRRAQISVEDEPLSP
jgi:stress response protein YsnF